MFINRSYYTLGVCRNAVKIETVDDIEPLAPAPSPGTTAALDPQELGAEDGLEHILSGEAIGSTLQVGLEREIIPAGCYQPFDLDKSMIHPRTLMLAGRPGKRTSIVSRVPGDAHPDTLQSTNNMGSLLQSMDKRG